MTNPVERQRADLDAYEDRARRGPCFVCAFASGHPDYGHHTVFEVEDHVAFLDRWPTLAGKVLVAPKRHVEYSLGSQQGNAHLHWHIAGLPPEVPHEQQFHALMAEDGVLAKGPEESVDMAARIRERIAARGGLRVL
ncbi:HIT family protein [Streptomyces sp. TRM72054]|uniref:HIT family protein n=1 Tax=Streptomyces sp. TRM72054 TaxID=2870562 RepID=UPI0027E16D0B|nr:HIT family protein [Streptomyces sp. TRM72054]